MSSKIEKITPQKAAVYMKFNTHNRPMSELGVEKLAGILRRGEWMLNGESIKFNCDGTLIDGQHRLMACIQSNVPFETYVVRGVLKDAFKTLDGQRKRGLADALAIGGKKNTVLLAAGVRALWNLLPPTRDVGCIMQNETITQTQGLEFLRKHPHLEASLQIVVNSGLRQLTQGSVMIALHYLFAKKDNAAADAFMNTVGSGENIVRKDPEYLLRNQLLDSKSSKSNLTPSYLAAITIKAWNARRSNRPLGTLKWSSNESFPEIV